MIIYKVVLFFTCIPGERFPLMEENICCYRSEYYKKNNKRQEAQLPVLQYLY